MAAYGDENITGERILKALSQFMASLISADSKYDRFRQGKEQFTSAESQGMVLFKQKCASCHSGTVYR
jgi:cytochrome c peroxidase